MSLIDTETKSKLMHTLKMYHEARSKTYSWVLNTIVFGMILLFAGTTVWLCYKNKKSTVEQYNQLLRDQEYVINKIRQYKGMQDAERLSTKLPVTENEHFLPF